MQTIALRFLVVVTFLLVCSNCSSEEVSPVSGGDVAPSVNWRKTHSIAEVKSFFSSGSPIADTVIIKAVVVSDDASRNIKNQIYLQDETAGLSLSFPKNDIHNKLSKGTEIFFLLTGSQYNNTSRLFEFPSGKTVDDLIGANVQILRTGLSTTFEVITTLTNLKPDFEFKLVKVYNVQFDENLTGSPFNKSGSDSFLTITDRQGQSVQVRISKDASFASDVIPYGSGNIEGILIYENNKPVITPSNKDDIVLTGLRHSLFTKTNFEKNGVNLPYQIMYPKGYDKSKKYPLIIFLHGAGERGSDNERQMAFGTQTFSSQFARENYSAMVIFPQCPSSDMWSRRTIDEVNGQRKFNIPVEEFPNTPMTMVIELTKQLVQTESVKTDQIYVMGLSMGSIGTLEYLYYAPEIPAAALPIAGGHDPGLVDKYASKVAIRLGYAPSDSLFGFLLE